MTIAAVTVSGTPITSLAPGASNSTAYTGAYTLTQDDIDRGYIYKYCYRYRYYLLLVRQLLIPMMTHRHLLLLQVSQSLKPELMLTNDPVGVYNAGDRITYAFTVTNTGNVVLTRCDGN